MSFSSIIRAGHAVHQPIERAAAEVLFPVRGTSLHERVLHELRVLTRVIRRLLDRAVLAIRVVATVGRGDDRDERHDRDRGRDDPDDETGPALRFRRRLPRRRLLPRRRRRRSTQRRGGQPGAAAAGCSPAGCSGVVAVGVPHDGQKRTSPSSVPPQFAQTISTPCHPLRCVRERDHAIDAASIACRHGPRPSRTTARRAARRDEAARQAGRCRFRTALGVIDNVEAADLSQAPKAEAGQHIAGGVAGLGVGEVARLHLSDPELVALLQAELANWESTAGECARAGCTDDAARLRADIVALQPLLTQP